MKKEAIQGSCVMGEFLSGQREIKKKRREYTHHLEIEGVDEMCFNKKKESSEIEEEKNIVEDFLEEKESEE